MEFAAFISQPRGLHNFIHDIRNAKNKDDERMRVDKELSNIRHKFTNSAALSSYDKKKYVWKLCYIYMLGYEVDFGHVEFISLLSSTKFQEKAVGYMAFSLMFRPTDELMTLAVNSMRNDIVSQVHAAQTLALSAVSNMGGTNLADALAPDVQRILLQAIDQHHAAYSNNPNITMEQEQRNRNLLVKKASLCLLRLYRTNPECVLMEDWMKRIAKLLEDRDFGVLTSVMSMLLGFVGVSSPISSNTNNNAASNNNTPSNINNAAIFEPLVPYVISILTRLVVDRICLADYQYYQIPSPWLQIKCLRFLQVYKLPVDATQLELLYDVLMKTMVRSSISSLEELLDNNHHHGGVSRASIAGIPIGGNSNTNNHTNNTYEITNKQNAENAILFEAINLIISYGPECHEAIREQALTLLGKFILWKDANIRYLAIDALTRLAKMEGSEMVSMHMIAIFDNLKDSDSSIKKRALNLLYVMANEKTAKEIVEELIKYLVIADASMKEDVVVKIAILAEKYTMANDDYAWYVSSMVETLLLAADYVAEGVAFRLIQVIVSHPEIHELAAEKMFTFIQSKLPHELLLFVAAYLLGEIGVNICDQPGKSGYDQFVALHTHFIHISPRLKALFCTTYMKFYNLYPEQCADLIIDIFGKYINHPFLELQQRAVEYQLLSSQYAPNTNNSNLIETLFNTMPAFDLQQRENLLLAMDNANNNTTNGMIMEEKITPGTNGSVHNNASELPDVRRASTVTATTSNSNTNVSNNNNPPPPPANRVSGSYIIY
jgi:AP-2 complex subunit alpha